jgi:hypothetical protein
MQKVLTETTQNPHKPHRIHTNHTESAQIIQKPYNPYKNHTNHTESTQTAQNPYKPHRIHTIDTKFTNNPGLCLHTFVARDVAKILKELAIMTTHEFHDAFEAKIETALTDDRTKATVVRQRGHTITFVALVDKPKAVLGEVRNWSVCRITQGTTEDSSPIVRCSDVGCRRGALKGLRVSAKSKPLCCHLDQTMQTMKDSNELRDLLVKGIAEDLPEAAVEDVIESDTESVISRAHEVAESDDEIEQADEETQTIADTISSLGQSLKETTKENNEVNPSMIPYEYCKETHRITPGPRCGQGPLPWQPSPEANEASDLRVRGKSIVFDENDKPKRNGRCLLGRDCIPKVDVCSRCGETKLEANNLVDSGKVFSECVALYGMVKRRIMYLKCPTCEERHEWNPDDDCIHTIYDKRVGGLFFAVCTESVQTVQSLHKAYRICTKRTESAQSVQNLYKPHRICTKRTESAQSVQNLHKPHRICTKRTESAQSVQNLHKAYRIDTKCTLSQPFLGGYELLYEYVQHVVGQEDQGSIKGHRGCGMSVGHWQKHRFALVAKGRQDFDAFFSPHQCRTFIESGVARIGLLFSNDICCPNGEINPCLPHTFSHVSISLGFDMVGGDGTAIGIPIDNVRTLSEVWVPPEGEIGAPWTSGRVDRCCIPNPSPQVASASDFGKARKAIAGYLTKVRDRAEVLPTLHLFPEPFSEELQLWMNHNTREKLDDTEQTALQKLLRSIISLACATHVLPELIIAHVKTALDNIQKYQPELVLLGVEDSRLWNYGMGPDVFSCLKAQGSSGKIRDSFVQLLRLVCEYGWFCAVYVWFVQFLYGVCRFCMVCAVSVQFLKVWSQIIGWLLS